MSTAAPFEERDWKYLSALREGFAEEFSRRANHELVALLRREDMSESDKRIAARRLSEDRQSDFQGLFGDWRRSTMNMQVFLFRKHGLLRDDHISALSEAAQKYIEQHFEKQH